MSRILTQSRAIVSRIADVLMPPRCPACGGVIGMHGTLCADCWNRLDRLDGPACACCGHPFATDLPGMHGMESRCGACLAVPPAFDWARAACRYEGLAIRLILALKHGDGLDGAAAMARLMLVAADPERLAPVDLILPVPLHGRRLFRRRYNQSQVLASALGTLLRRPVEAGVLTRARATPTQGGLGRKARFRNVKGAFRVDGASRIRGANVLLVDDVLTTGATASACAKALKRAGAASVGVLTFARVDPGRASGNTGFGVGGL